MASLTSTGRPWGRRDRTWPLLPVQPHPGPSGDCPEAQNPSLTEPDHFLSPPCVSEPPWKLVEKKKKKAHPTQELPLHESPGNSDAQPGLKISSPEHLTRFTGGDLEAGVSRVSRHTCPFPSVLPPRGPPCKHWPHFRMSLKLRSSTVFAVGVWVKPAEDEAGGHWENPPEPALRTHALPCSALCWQILLSPWCLAPGNSEGQALGLDCLLLASEGRMMCVSTLDLEHPEEKYSLVRVFFFFFYPRFSQPKRPKISQ